MPDVLHFTRFMLVRHAQARSSDAMYGPETPLSELGVQQASLLGTRLKPSYPVTAIYSSPLPRALQTAAPVAAGIGLSVRIDERLAEFDLEPAPLDPAAASLVWKPEDRGKDGGETVAEFFDRVAMVCESICASHVDETVILVTHAGVIDAVYRWATGAPRGSGWSFEVEVPNASVSEIQVWPRGRVRGGAPRLSVLGPVGDVSHLGEHTSAL
jgi:broad specificity phosphatase PhoE